MSHTFKQYASVILDLNIDKALDYGVNDEHIDIIQEGMRVNVLVRGFLRKGLVLNLKKSSAMSRVLPIQSIISDTPFLMNDLKELALWMARYYQAPLGKVLKCFLPSGVRKEKGHKQQHQIALAKKFTCIRDICIELRHKCPAQAKVLDVMLAVKKELLLTELLEKAQVSRSSVHSLIQRGVLKSKLIQIDRSPLTDEEYFLTKPKVFNPEQQLVFNDIVQTLNNNEYRTHLLHGVTGSGKTEVYLQTIQHALHLKRSVLMLVPEIALTTQTIEHFRSRFKEKIAILHYRLSQGERYDEWHRIRRGEANIVIGARSAIFSPLQNLGLIILDEEHEQSYKQSDEMPCYHARDIAVMRAYLNKACVILGSATPSLESYYNTKQNKYVLNTLNHRADRATLPEIKLVDMKKEFEKSKGFTSFSDLLLTEIKARYLKGEQTILFLNRRGYHTSQICQECQTVVNCPHCEMSLTFHLGENRLTCHLCGYFVSPPPKTCPQCNGAKTMKFKGVGTQQIERALHAIFPDIRTIRMDADTTRHKGSYDTLFYAFRNHKADVLIGTQMIAKGLHFPGVTLVGVLNSDSALQIPDFRASEYVFQLMTQVAGRAGRCEIKGKVIIQTLSPDNVVFDMALKQNYHQFYLHEMSSRQCFDYPPYRHMVKYAFTGKDENKTLKYANQFFAFLKKQLPKEYQLQSVVPCGYPKVKDHYRFQFFVRGSYMYLLQQKSALVQKACFLPKEVRLFIDVDPTSTFF